MCRAKASTGATCRTGPLAQSRPAGTSMPRATSRPCRRKHRRSLTGIATTPPTRRRRWAASACLPGAPVTTRPWGPRPDVLVYPPDELGEPLELVGPVEAELHVASSLDHTDFF